MSIMISKSLFSENYYLALIQIIFYRFLFDHLNLNSMTAI